MCCMPASHVQFPGDLWLILWEQASDVTTTTPTPPNISKFKIKNCATHKISSICDTIWENPLHGENLTFGVFSTIYKILISFFWN